MFADDTTQTTQPTDGDAGEHTPATETGPEGERAGTSEGDYHKRQALENKVKAEKLNALLAANGVSSVEELNERIAQSPAAPSHEPPDDDDDPDDAERRAVGEFAAKGDPVARYAQKLEQRLDRLTKGVGDALTARDIPDAVERKAAVAHYQKNRHRLGDLSAALAELRAPKLATENARLTAELARLQNKPGDPDVANAPRTGGQETTTPTTTKRKMTGAQFDAEVARLHAEKKHHSALNLQRAYADGDIVLTG
jgi:hypothetical protein